MTGPSHTLGPSTPPRLGILLSGSGRTLINILDRIESGRLNAHVSIVIASRECLGAQRARDRGLDTRIVPGVIPGADLASLLQSAQAQWAVLAGYLKYINVPIEYRGRVVNIHPALLPAFGGQGMYGHRVHEAVLAAGCRVSGCTVHIVDEEFDHGPILVQRACEVREDDSPESLAERVFRLECEAYPEALELLLSGRVQLEGARARIRP
ncbi:MAG: phosphoribosylglycinamide formyltransferase [Phycisphaeraceae bacterium]|nr:phosphoribosylglycinamide formyltransferase [Phycisphaeraceae bacterium]